MWTKSRQALEILTADNEGKNDRGTKTIRGKKEYEREPEREQRKRAKQNKDFSHSALWTLPAMRSACPIARPDPPAHACGRILLGGVSFVSIFCVDICLFTVHNRKQGEAFQFARQERDGRSPKSD